MKKMITALLALLMLAGCTPQEKPTEYAEMIEGKTTYRYDQAVELNNKALARIDAAMNHDDKRAYTVIYHFYYDGEGVFLKGEMEYLLDSTLDAQQFVNKVLDQTTFKKVRINGTNSIIVTDKKFTYYNTFSYSDCLQVLEKDDNFHDVTVYFTETGREAYFSKYVLKQG